MKRSASVNPSSSRDVLNDAQYSRTRSSADLDRYRQGQSEHCPENVLSTLMPSGLNSMLKNTTETGDIGVFSIKPSRLPRHAVKSTVGNAPPKSLDGNHTDPHNRRQSLPDVRFSNISSAVVGRKPLPSNNRDITSDVAPSEGSRLSEDADRRSSSYAPSSTSGLKRVASRKSYTSLKSQTDQNPTQRPRSPFPYPARLKRPGFRPSSPALTDGGAVDYSRRAEIEREPATTDALPLQTANKNREPPRSSSLADSAFSMPSSVGPLSPSVIQQLPSAAKPTDTASKLTENVGGNTETSFLEAYDASSAPPSDTAMLGSAPSVTIPGPPKLHSPSPLYYDYTENFCEDYKIDEEPAAAEMEPQPSPPFLVEKTIHEDRELSSDWSYLAMADLAGCGFLASESLLMLHEEQRDNSKDEDLDTSYASKSESEPNGIVRRRSDSPKDSINSVSSVSTSDGSKSQRLEDADNHSTKTPKSVSSEPLDPKMSDEDIYNGTNCQKVRIMGLNSESLSKDSTHARSHPDLSAHSALSRHSPTYHSSIMTTRDQPDTTIETRSADVPDDCEVAGSIGSNAPRLSLNFEIGEPIAQDTSNCILSHHLDGHSTSLQADHGNSDQHRQMKTDLGRDEQPATRSSSIVPSDGQSREVEEMPLDSSLPNFSRPTGKRYHTERVTLPDVRIEPTLNKYKSDSDLRVPKYATMRRPLSNTAGLPSALDKEYQEPEVSSRLQHLRHSELAPSSGILSPLPIYPARELKVKNSIPRLTNSLAPLSLRNAASRDAMSQARTPSPLPTGGKCLPAAESAAGTSNASNSTTPANSMQHQTPLGSTTQPLLSKFKLKTRQSPVRAPASTLATRPGPVHEYDGCHSIAQLPAAPSGEATAASTPKLKLKLASASLSSLGTVRVNKREPSHNENSSSDTVRVNKGASNQNEVSNSELSPPADLFSPPSGLKNLFRQASRHFNFAGPSVEPSARTAVEGSQNTVIPATLNGQDTRPPIFDIASQNVSSPIAPRAYSQEASASAGDDPFCDSVKPVPRETPWSLNKPAGTWKDAQGIRKHSHGTSPLQDKGSRPGREPSIDIVWRPRDAGVASSNDPGLNVVVLNDGSGLGPTTRSQKLKTKISSWMSDARATIFACIRSRKSTGVTMGMAGEKHHR